MSNSDAFLLGLALILASAILLLAARSLLRGYRRRIGQRVEADEEEAIALDRPENGVLVCSREGQLLHSNARAREWFEFDRQPLDIKEIGHQARPYMALATLSQQEGRAVLWANGVTLAAESHRLPDQMGGHMVILLDPSTERITRLATPEVRGTSLTPLAEAIHVMRRQQDRRALVRVIHDVVREVLPCDLVEVNLWDPAQEAYTPFRSGHHQSYDFANGQEPSFYTPGEGYTGWLVQHRRPLLVRDVSRRVEPTPVVDRDQFPFNAYLGVPLEVGAELVGTLEIASYQTEAYNQNDLELLEILAGQAASALHRAQLQVRQEGREAEIEHVSRLLTLGTSEAEESLIPRLTRHVARAIDANIVGFLLNDPNTDYLLARAPFVGLPSQLVERYGRIPLPPDGDAEGLLLFADHLLVNDPSEDPRIELLGLDGLCDQAGIHNLLLVPLRGAGEGMGLLLAANKGARQPFAEHDTRLLSVLGAQCALIIEHARLVQESRAQNELGEALRRAASLAMIREPEEDALQTLTSRFADQVKAEIALLVREGAEGQPEIQTVSSAGTPMELLTEQLHALESKGLLLDLAGDLQGPCLSNDPSHDQRLPGALRAVGEELELGRLMVLPISFQGEALGFALLGRQRGAPFTPGQLEMASISLQMLAAGLLHKRRGRLAARTQQEMGSRLRELARVAEKLNRITDLERILTLVHDHAIRMLGASCGRTLVFEGGGAVSSETIALHVGDRLPDTGLGSLARITMETGEAQAVGDYQEAGQEAEHEGIRSAATAYISQAGGFVGLIHLHSPEPNHFDELSLQVLGILAVEAGIALEHSRRHENHLRVQASLEGELEDLRRLLGAIDTLRPDRPLGECFENLASALQSVTPSEIVLLEALEAETNKVRPLALVGTSPGTLEALRESAHTWEELLVIAERGQLLSRSHLLPANQIFSTAPESWSDLEALLVPLYAHSGDPLGCLVLIDPNARQVFDKHAVRRVESLASVAASLMDTLLTYECHKESSQTAPRAEPGERADMQEPPHQAADLLWSEPPVEEAHAREQKHLTWIAELTSALAARTAEEDPSVVLRRYAHSLREVLGLDWVLLAGLRAGAVNPEQLTTAPQDWAPDHLESGELEAVQESLPQDRPLFAERIEEGGLWAESEPLRSAGVGSFASLPLLGEEGPVAVALLMSTSPVMPFEEDDMPMISSLLHQLMPLFVAR